MVNPFERLHPAVRHHVVNSLGWRTLRAHQEAAIEPILRGDHVLIQAPTAGGKTEAAVLPALSRMLAEEWSATSVIYFCPIKALLNDLEHRLRMLAGLVGRRVALWHGDVGQAARRRITAEPPDILLATPESVEVMLVSRLVEHRRFFGNLRAVVVDEVHALAGDDRGWHLLALLERMTVLADGPVQRIALSATLSNAADLLAWLTPSTGEPGEASRRHVVGGMVRVAAGSGDSLQSSPSDAEVQIDFVGNLGNAAQVIARLHRGEKRLVFCDSRSRVEELAQALRSHGVDTYVSHSSLSADERRRAEAAFSGGADCVIVATSTLELGIDIGDLDRVIQIDAPFSVAGFLQRLGRSGRRAGGRRNCLFLTTNDEALLRAAGIVRLWQDGYVEPVEPLPLPYHVLAQQVIALALQDRGVERLRLDSWLGRWLKAASIGDDVAQEIIDFMLAEGILFQDGGLLSVGVAGESRFGAKNFLEIFSVFQSPPMFSVLHGRTEIGHVHELTFRHRRDGPVRLALAGRAWTVTYVDHARKRAFVEPADEAGKSRWPGSGQVMRMELCQAMKEALANGLDERVLSRRATARLAELREEMAGIRMDATAIVIDENSARAVWWNFAGSLYNAAVEDRLRTAGWGHAFADGLSVSLRVVDSRAVGDRIASVIADLAENPEVSIDPEAIEGVKFGDCVPGPRIRAMLEARAALTGEPRLVAQQRLQVRVLA